MNTRKVVRAILIVLMSAVILNGEYQIFIKGPEYTKPQSGTVISSYESHGRHSSEWLATVRFDNGDTQGVNTGDKEYKPGDRFTGQLSWSPLLGVCGTAYSWNPGDWLLWATMPAAVFNVLAVLGLIAAAFIYAFGKREKS